MKVVETIERDCCQPQDLVTYKGKPFGGYDRLRYCKYCKQLWHWIRNLGEMDAGWEKVTDTNYEAE